MYQQLVAPNLSQTSKAGLCLQFSRMAFKAPAVEASAWKGWLNTKYKHTDRNLPNVCVPVWFQHFGSYGSPAVYDNWGHVAIHVPGMGFLSSPITFVGPGQQWFNSIEELVNAMNRIVPGSKTAYVGWSEDISNVRVAQEEEVIDDKDNNYGRWNKLFLQIRGRNASRDEFRTWGVGRSWITAIEMLSDSEEADTATSWQAVGQMAVSDKWQQKIQELSSQLQTAKDEAAALLNDSTSTKAQLEEALKKIADLQTPKPPIQPNVDPLGRKLVEFLKKLFKKG